jgi:hypothetical protein
VIGAYRPYERHHRNQSSITYHWLLIMPADGRPQQHPRNFPLPTA